MRPLFRSAVRVLAACLATLSILLGLAAVAVTQPTFGTGPRWDGPAPDPARLRRHVQFLTIDASPRDVEHPETSKRQRPTSGTASRPPASRSAISASDSGAMITETSSPRSVPKPVRSW